MNINYNNINELINLLHEFVYESKKDTYNKYTGVTEAKKKIKGWLDKYK